jgi:hypothetical protein
MQAFRQLFFKKIIFLKIVKEFGGIEKCSYICGVKKYIEQKNSQSLSQAIGNQSINLKNQKS